jgi:lipopolysaccharide/colanic/teichoic acid biosynthesis glycosyltransferase
MTTAVKAKAITRKTSGPRIVSSPARSDAALRRSTPQASRSVPRSVDFPTPEPTGRHLVSSSPVPTWKRGLDVSCILLSLPLTLPLIAAITLWVKLASRGPALFRQERIGRNGKRFVLYKFRSMKNNADTTRHKNHFRHLVSTDSPMVKLDLLCDSRLIPGGCLLRAAGLDELPQLLNVLRGEMSLVGPRPCLPEEFRFFSSRQRERFEALPGLTGIWQVHGKGVSSFSEMNAMDAIYVRRSSITLDLGIMLRTPVALLHQMYQAFLQHREASRKPAESEESALSGYSTQRLG